MAELTVRRLGPDEVGPWIGAVAELRIAVFREFPYLYDGSLEYEAKYLRRYVDTEDSIIIGAFEDGRLVGASTGVPLTAEPSEVQAPFLAHGDDPKQWFYFGESVLRQPWRGRGIGVAFFREREAHAARLGLRRTCFCRVVRPSAHPRCPADYRPLDEFWARRGYAPLPGYFGSMRWRDLDEREESPKTMEFWAKTL